MLPVWLLGLFVWRVRARIPPWCGWQLIVASLLAYLVLAITGAGPRFGAFIDATLLHGRWLGWSRLLAWKYVLGLLVALNILGFAAIAEQVSFGRAARTIRAIAGATFTLYLLHYPLLSFFGAVMPGPDPGPLRALEIGTLTLFCVATLAQVTEKRKDWLRRWLDRIPSGASRIPTPTHRRGRSP